MNNQRKHSRQIQRLLLFFLLISCGGITLTTAASSKEPITVCVSIVPQKYFTEKIGGTLVDVNVMVEPGSNPANYEPKPRQMVALAKTMIYFSIGVPFENAWLDKIAAANPKMQIVRTQKGIEKIRMKRHIGHHDGDHPQEVQKRSDDHTAKPHQHGIKDPHIWLSPPLVMLQARNILHALTNADPAHRSVYETNYKIFINEIVDLDAELRIMFAENLGHKEFMVFHPAWGYFADAYGLSQIAVEIEGKEPKPADLKHLIEYARKRGIQVVFVQPQFSTKSAAVIAGAIQGQTVFADPLAPDWAENLRRTGTKFVGIFK